MITLKDNSTYQYVFLSFDSDPKKEKFNYGPATLDSSLFPIYLTDILLLNESLQENEIPEKVEV